MYYWVKAIEGFLFLALHDNVIYVIPLQHLCTNLSRSVCHVLSKTTPFNHSLLYGLTAYLL